MPLSSAAKRCQAIATLNSLITALHLFYAKCSSSVASIFPIIRAIVMQFVPFHWMFHWCTWIIDASLDQPLSESKHISHGLHFSSVFLRGKLSIEYTHSLMAVYFFFFLVYTLFIISVNHSILLAANVRSQSKRKQHSFILWSIMLETLLWCIFQILYLSIWRLLRSIVQHFGWNSHQCVHHTWKKK